MSGGQRGHVQLRHVSIDYDARSVVRDISLDIAPGEFVCLLGPSGCGKTTTLRAIAGLVAIASGTILIDDKPVQNLPAHRRDIGMVFQDLALFPHMTVGDNIAFGLRLRRVDARTIEREVAAILSLLHLDGLRDRLPRQLSGGQQQRVAIARSLVVRPSVLLLDEPFAALDRKLREEMRAEIRGLQRRLGITVVFVTHDQEEALATMSDRVCVMTHGVLEQVGTPSEIYERPASRFVMSFVGYANFLTVTDVRRAGDELLCQLADQSIRLSGGTIADDTAREQREIAIRPEHIRVATGGTSQANRIAGTVREIAYEGVSVTYDVAVAGEQILKLREQNVGAAAARRKPAIGEAIILEWGVEDAVLVGDPP